MKAHSILDNRYISIAILITLLITVVCIWFWLPGYLNKDVTDIRDKGVIGDSYGSVNALFTGLAFAGLIFTILLQQREMSLQRLDFEAQVNEMKLARKESARQANIQQNQVLLSLAQLKMKQLEVDVEKIKIDSLQWVEHVRHQHAIPKLTSVQEQMQKVIEEVSEKIV